MQACVWSASWLLGSEGGALGTADDPKAAPHLGPPAHHPTLLPSGMQVDPPPPPLLPTPRPPCWRNLLPCHKR